MIKTEAIILFTQHYPLSMTWAESQAVTNIICLGLQERLGCIYYDAEFDDALRSWWNTTDNGSRCQRSDKEYRNPHFGLRNRCALTWSKLYKAADKAIKKPLIFCLKYVKQLSHPKNNNTS